MQLEELNFFLGVVKLGLLSKELCCLKSFMWLVQSKPLFKTKFPYNTLLLNLLWHRRPSIPFPTLLWPSWSHLCVCRSMCSGLNSVKWRWWGCAYQCAGTIRVWLVAAKRVFLIGPVLSNGSGGTVFSPMLDPAKPLRAYISFLSLQMVAE